MQFKVGAKQTMKMLEQHRAIQILVARDAESHVIDKVIQQCERSGVPVKWIESMEILGETCGIDIGAAMAAIIAEEE